MVGIIDLSHLLIGNVLSIKLDKPCSCGSFEVSPGNTLFLEDVGMSSKMDICSPEDMKSDLSEILGEVINAMVSYLFFTFYSELQL